MKIDNWLSEIRYMIWNCLFAEVTINITSDEGFSARPTGDPVRPLAVDFKHKDLSILATCKSVYQEAKPVFWYKTTFFFARTRDLKHFLKQRSLLPGPRIYTNAANIQHVRLANDDINNVQHVSHGRVLARLARGDSMVSLVIQHDDRWPCWCERCLDVQEVFDVEWEERHAERLAEEERIQELEKRNERELEKTLAENEDAMKGYEDLFTED